MLLIRILMLLTTNYSGKRIRVNKCILSLIIFKVSAICTASALRRTTYTKVALQNLDLRYSLLSSRYHQLTQYTVNWSIYLVT